MIIGIDIDDTLVDTRVLLKDCWKEYIGFYPNDNYTEELPDDINTGWDNPYINRFWDMFRDYLAFSTKAKEGASKALKEFKKDGHEIRIITSREVESYNDLHGMIRRQFESFDFVYDRIVTNVRVKGIYCKNHKVDVLIDDLPNQIKSALDNGVDAIQMTEDTTWESVVEKVKVLSKKKEIN